MGWGEFKTTGSDDADGVDTRKPFSRCLAGLVFYPVIGAAVSLIVPYWQCIETYLSLLLRLSGQPTQIGMPFWSFPSKGEAAAWAISFAVLGFILGVVNLIKYFRRRENEA